MNYRVVYLDKAKVDIKDIVEYLAQFYKSTARTFMENFRDKVNTLKNGR